MHIFYFWDSWANRLAEKWAGIYFGLAVGHCIVRWILITQLMLAKWERTSLNLHWSLKCEQQGKNIFLLLHRVWPSNFHIFRILHFPQIQGLGPQIILMGKWSETRPQFHSMFSGLNLTSQHTFLWYCWADLQIKAILNFHIFQILLISSPVKQKNLLVWKRRTARKSILLLCVNRIYLWLWQENFGVAMLPFL